MIDEAANVTLEVFGDPDEALVGVLAELNARGLDTVNNFTWTADDAWVANIVSIGVRHLDDVQEIVDTAVGLPFVVAAVGGYAPTPGGVR